MRHARIAIALLLVPFAAPGASRPTGGCTEADRERQHRSAARRGRTKSAAACRGAGAELHDIAAGIARLPGPQRGDPSVAERQSSPRSAMGRAMPACSSNMRSIRRSPAPTPSPTRRSPSAMPRSRRPRARRWCALPRIAFEAFIPDTASSLRPVCRRTGLSVEQTIQRSSEQLKVGDAVTRIVTIKAEGTPGDAAAAAQASRPSTDLRSIRRSLRCRTRRTGGPTC